MIIISHVAGLTIRWRALISVGVTSNTICGLMRPGQWEVGVVVIKRTSTVPGWVTSQTGGGVIDISADAIVLIICFRVDVAVRAGDDGPHTNSGMAICTLAPYAIMFTTIDREILFIMIEACRDPGVFSMALSAIY